MKDLLILYYALCYTAGGVGLIVSLIAARSLAGPRDGRFAAVSGSLALILVPFFVLSYLGSRGDGSPLRLALWLVIVAGESLLIASLPRFIHSMFPRPRERAMERAWAAAALASLASIPLTLLFPRFPALLFIPMVLMPAAILYAVIASVAGLRAGPPQASNAGEGARWLSLIKAVTLLSIAFLPIMLAFDFFPLLAAGLGRALGIAFPPFLKAFPLFYALVSLAYATKTVPLLLRAEPSAEIPAGDEAAIAASAGLSEREAEVARLLVSGLRYREIGERLFISLSTVKTHVERIYRKTGARNKMELARKMSGS